MKTPKILNLSPQIATLTGSFKSTIALPDGTDGAINFEFEYNLEHDWFRIWAGNLLVGKNASISFERISLLRFQRHGRVPEDWDISEILFAAFENFHNYLKNAKFEVILK